jgi:hypothetical protein
MRDSKVLIVRHVGLLGSFMMAVPSLCPSHKFVHPPQKSAFL